MSESADLKALRLELQELRNSVSSEKLELLNVRIRTLSRVVRLSEQLEQLRILEERQHGFNQAVSLFLSQLKSQFAAAGYPVPDIPIPKPPPPLPPPKKEDEE